MSQNETFPTRREHPFESRLAASWPPAAWREAGVVVAVSGGADSVALLRGLERLRTPGGGRLAAAHFNHGLRGSDADADERFVIALCERLAVPCRVGRAAAGLNDRASDGLEAAARAARYAFLQELAEELGARHVVTAHNALDQAETVLHHILRGTGLAGLAGIPRARLLTPAVTLLRPLLSIGRAEIEGYLASLGQPYCRDETNLNPDMTRNRIRHDLIPLLEREFNPDVVAALGRLGQLAGDAQRTIEARAGDLLDAALKSRGPTEGIFDCRPLAAADRHLAREAFVAFWRRQGWPMQAMGFDEWDSLAAMARAEARADARGTSTIRRAFPGGVIVERVEDVFTASRLLNPPNPGAGAGG